MTADQESKTPSSFSLKSVAPGLALAILTVLFGQLLGVVFGLNEEAILSRLHASAVAVQDSVYQGDEAAMKKVEDKSWKYMQRAHLHAGAMGTTALVLITIVALLGTSRIACLAISLALGAGSFGYSLFWMWAGFRAPGLGGTGAAKESLRWLAMPSAGATVLATAAVLILVLAHFRSHRSRP